jgi:hypothetical protein
MMFSAEAAAAEARACLLLLRMAIAAGEGPAGPEEGRGEETELRGGWPMDEEVEFELRAMSETGDASTSVSVSTFS